MGATKKQRVQNKEKGAEVRGEKIAADSKWKEEKKKLEKLQW